MTKYPNALDDDSSLPAVNNNITQIGEAAINAQRDAIFALEESVGTNPAGTAGSLAARIGVSLDDAGVIKPSVLTSLGLVTLPITNNQIKDNAGIPESKLTLDHATIDLYNYIQDLSRGVDTALGYINITGSKLNPHLAGTLYRHVMADIDVSHNSSDFLINKFRLLRDNGQSYNLVKDINQELITHQWTDGSIIPNIANIQTNSGLLYPSNYGHIADGIYLNSSRFSFIPQTIHDLQEFAEFVDSANLFLLGSRIQTLYANGIPRTARSSRLNSQTLGQSIITVTNATTFLLYGGSTTPVDNIDHGDDIIQLLPSSSASSTNNFDASFSQVRVGDIITVNYGSFSVSSIIVEKKYNVDNSGNKTFAVRIDGKNLAAASVTVTIDRSLFNTNKYGVLALAQANHNMVGILPSITIGNPRGAQVLGIGFNPDTINSTHYNLYLAVYPNGGNPLNSIFPLPPIDVSGNKGLTPGEYTLDGIVEATNNAFRASGFNNRFIAFSYNGEFGLMLTDAINNISFSIIDGVVASSGNYDQNLSNTLYPNNVIGVPGFDNTDPLGLGSNNGSFSSPPFSSSYVNTLTAQIPTKIFVPLTRDNYYVNGVETERFALEPNMLLDGYGDGYWPAVILNKNIIPGTRVEVTYQIPFNLQTSHLQIGKTITVVGGPGSTFVDSGRFFISNIQFNSCTVSNSTATTNITVYDAVQSPNGVSPSSSAPIGTNVSLYFGSDSVGFDAENMSDIISVSPFKRNMEILINQDGYTFSHERARMNILGSTLVVNSVPLYSNSILSNINIVKVSPKLRGYIFSSVNKINLHINSYNSTTGVYVGYLCKFDGSVISHQGPLTTGKKGEVTRFYDQSNIDYIDFVFNLNDTISTISSPVSIDIQLFATLSLDEEIMLLGTVQVNNQTNTISYLKDGRQFGNVSEEQLSTSALDFIAAPTRLLQENGIIRGFDITSVDNTNGTGIISINGGTAFINGKIIQINQNTTLTPIVAEVLPPTFVTQIAQITWYLCVNDKGEFEFIASTDFDPNGANATLYNAAGVDYNRIFYVTNTNNSNSNHYAIRGTFFSDLVLNYKDVTPIAIINSSVPGSTISSITAADARRFVGNGYGGLTSPFVLSSEEGNFNSIVALNSWLTQLLNLKSSVDGINNQGNGIGATVIVKGNNLINSSSTLDYAKPVIFKGDGGSFTITSDQAFIIGNNVTFNNIRFDYLYDPVANSDSFYNSAMLCNPAKAAIYCTVSSTLGNQNIVIDNCVFVSPNQNRFGFIGFNFTASSCMLQNVSITNNLFQTSFAGEDKLAVISMQGPTASSTDINGPRLINCVIDHNQCNKNQLICISSALNSLNINNLITPVNTKITRNTCGAINFLMKQDIPFDSVSTPNTVYSLDKSANLSIKENNCKFIYSGLANGRINVPTQATTTIASGSNAAILPQSTINVISTVGFPNFGLLYVTSSLGTQIVSYTGITSTSFTGCSGGLGTLSTSNAVSVNTRVVNYLASGLFTCFTDISQNNISWIHTGSVVSNNHNAALNFEYNNFNAYDSNFLNDYYSGYSSLNIALINDKIVGS